MKTILAALTAAAVLYGQQPQIENAKLESRPFRGSLASQLKSFGAGPFWAAWSEPIISRQSGDMCSWNLDGGRATNAPVRLEGPVSLIVLVRVENSQLDRMRVTSGDCRFDGGGLPFYWLNNVPAAESVSWLKSQIGGRQLESAVMAISLHAGPDADRALDDLVAPGQPPHVRERTAFWLSVSRGAHGVDVLKRMLADDPDERVKEQVIFALYVSKDPAGLTTLIDTARKNPDPALRRKAMFWLGQSKDPRAFDFLAQLLKN